MCFVDPWWWKDTGAQPLFNEDGSLVLAVNGEIYNHRVLRKQLKTPYNFKTHSDCEVIIPLVRKGFLTNIGWTLTDGSMKNMMLTRRNFSMECFPGPSTTGNRTG